MRDSPYRYETTGLLVRAEAVLVIEEIHALLPWLHNLFLDAAYARHTVVFPRVAKMGRCRDGG